MTQERSERWLVTAGCLLAMVSGAITITIVVVIVHFLAKVW